MKTILVGIAGSIASIRGPDVIKALRTQSFRTRCVLTQSGARFTTPDAIEAFSGEPVLSDDPFGADHKGTDHITLARESDLCLIYGASANFIAKYRAGICDTFLLLQLIATRAPVVLAPAMNPEMWKHPSVQENVAVLKNRGVHFVDPIAGKVACGETGVGHVADTAEIISKISGILSIPSTQNLDLSGRKILISAGPMRTALDPVRYLQNRSSGKMGLALARLCLENQAEVTVLLGPVHESVRKEFSKFNVTEYESASDYEGKLLKLFPQCDVFFSAAAVLDFELESETKKIERKNLPGGTLKMKYHAVPDLVAKVAARKKKHQTVIAFAAETGTDSQIIERATLKMKKKQVDAIIANPVREGLGPDADQNLIWIIQPGKTTRSFGPADKTQIASEILKNTLIGPLAKLR